VTEHARVLVADDHPPTRTGVRRVLEENGFVVCAEAATAAEAVEAALRERPDVCLLDIRMPGTGLAAAAEISTKLPDASIVMLTVSRDDNDLFDALRAGASGYLLKDMKREQLPAALRQVLSGEASLPPILVARVIEEFRGRERRRLGLLAARPDVRLRKREWEVLELLHDGLSTAEIAKRLFIAEVTVRSHVSAILKALRVPDREHAVRLLDDSAHSI
jgi:DNA-binding NarL/FixJ family response regulator